MLVVGVEDVVLRRRGRQHDDGDPPQVRVALHLGEHLAAVDAGQVEVEQHEVGPRRGSEVALLVEELERLDAVARDVQPRPRVRGLLERLLRQPDVGGVVLDEQDVDETAVGHAGSVKRNTVPPSSLGSTQIRPRWVATILAHTASPIPVPSCPAAARWNGSKIRSA